jgi:hypothetical protein
MDLTIKPLGEIMKSIVPLAVLAVCCWGVLPASAESIEGDARLALMDKALNCMANNVKNGVDWEDICYTSSESSFSDKDRMVAKSLEQAIEEHEAQSQDAKTVDMIEVEHADYADTYSKSVDDVIEEQGVYNGVEPVSGAEDSASDDLNSSRADQPYVQYAQATANDYPAYTPPPSRGVDFSPQGSLRESHRPLMDRLTNQNKTEIGLEFNRFRYTEPIFDLEDNGNLFGAYASYTARPGKEDGLYDDIIDMYKAEMRFNYGHVNYESSGSGTLDDIPDWTFEARLLAGKDLPVFTDSRLTPYVGLGYRYLNDNSSGMLTSVGHSGYEREANYFYIPIGVEFTTALTDGWLVSPTGEFDFFVAGTQKSHIEDVNPAAPTIKNDQKSGYGLRGSIKFIKETDPVNFVIEPYIRYWHIEDSEVVEAVGSFWMEPENTSREYGVRLGAEF